MIKLPQAKFAQITTIFAGLIFLTGLLTFVFFKMESNRIEISLHDLLSMPIQTVDGQTINLSDGEHSKYPVIIVNFWASWCPPCAEELPSLLKLVRKFEGQVLILAISQDEDLAKMNSFLEQYGKLPKQFAVIWDKDSQYKKIFKAEKLPESWIFDKDRKLNKKINGFEDWGTPGALQYFKELVDK